MEIMCALVLFFILDCGACNMFVKKCIILCSLFLLVTRMEASPSSFSNIPHTWIIFSDKGQERNDPQALAEAEARLSVRAKMRRAKVMSTGCLVDMTDLPVRPEYLQEIARHGLQIHAVSKWLNAVSVSGTAQQLRSVQQLSFVANQAPVLCFAKRPVNEPAKLKKFSTMTEFDYGASFNQNNIMKVPAVHNLGITGQGVLIALFDSGFRLNHEAFSKLKVLAEYDFIHKDANPDLEPGDVSSQISHGTMVLSVLAGYSPGNLIGPAYAGEYILAKTEDTGSEKPIEEDYWIAAAEWADSLGADIISSSLGYNDWYEYRNMDGHTAPITRAADLAVKKGILVVVAAGNEGNGYWKYILAPADGDSVIAVGAVQGTGTIASFSSQGPTFDGRIKPDIVAMGVGVSCIAVPPNLGVGSNYSSMSGTSAATPLAAGAAALILSAHPDLTPMQVREALLKTADRAQNPDNTYGYGLIDAFAALNYWGRPEMLPEKNRLIGCYPNPFAPRRQSRLQIVVDLMNESMVQIDIYNLLGQKVTAIYHGYRSAGKKRQWSWSGLDDRGQRVASGIYLVRFKSGSFSATQKITLLN
jgi:serine protease AprX